MTKCFYNHLVVTLVGDKLRRQWLQEGNNSVSNLNQNHTLQMTALTTAVSKNHSKNIDKAGCYICKIACGCYSILLIQAHSQIFSGY